VAASKQANFQGNSDAVQAGAVYLVYEYASYDFTGLLDGSLPLSRAAIRSYTYQLLAGLAHLHDDKVRIVHRDIKCSNILLTEDNTVKIADFGLARRFEKHMGRASRPMSTNVITLWYRPPELLLGATTYDSRVDVWSAGCIVLELLIGKPLFRGSTDALQLGLIFKLLGTPGQHSSLRQLPHWSIAFKEGASKLRAEIARLCDTRKMQLPPAAVDLMESLLALDPRQRPLAMDALRHPWFTQHGQGEVPLNPSRPSAGLPPVSQLAGLDPSLDYHEFAARERKKEKRAGGSDKRDRGSKRSREDPSNGSGSRPGQ
jgi:serine/threonine protein kinase